MSLKNNHPSINIRDGKFWYKFLIGSAILILIFGMYIKEMVDIGNFKNEILTGFNTDSIQNSTLTEFHNQLNAKFGSDPRLSGISIIPSTGDNNGTLYVESLKVGAGFGEYTVQTLSYFTILSNVAVAAGLLTAAFKPHQEGHKGFLNYQSSLIVTTVITITMLIGLAMLMPTRVASGDELNGLFGFVGLMEHAVFPILFIVYLCFVGKPAKTLTSKEYMQKGGGKIILVLLIYGIYALVRGEMRYQGNRPYDTQYPYFFLRIHETKVVGMPGYAWFIVALAIIIGICLGFSLAYNAIIRYRFQASRSKTKTK